jgi:hypothetical protein
MKVYTLFYRGTICARVFESKELSRISGAGRRGVI